MFYLYTNRIQIVNSFFIKNCYNYQMVMFLPTKYSGDLNETNKNQRPATKCGCGLFKMLSSNPQFWWWSLIFIWQY